MASHEDIALMAHLLRRAGFGASRAEVEAKAAQGYHAVVEELLHPEAQPSLEEDLMEGVSELWICYPLLEEETHQSE